MAWWGRELGRMDGSVGVPRESGERGLTGRFVRCRFASIGGHAAQRCSRPTPSIVNGAVERPDKGQAGRQIGDGGEGSATRRAGELAGPACDFEFAQDDEVSDLIED